jgi:hypothetical protein
MVTGFCLICCTLLLQNCFASSSDDKTMPSLKSLADANADKAQMTGISPDKSKLPTEPITGKMLVVDVNEPVGLHPNIVFEQTVHDLGLIAPSSVNTCEFKFCNKGEGKLKISEITRTCGCTVFKLAKNDYAPGECGKIAVQYNADGTVGLRQRHLHVLSNDPNNPNVELTIKASITQKVTFEPERLEYKLKGENAGAAELVLKSVDKQFFKITQINSTNDAVMADFNPGQAAEKFVLKTKLDAAKMGTSSFGRIEIKVTHPDCTAVTVPFSLIPRFRSDPAAINIINAEPGKPVQKELWLLNNYNDDFDIDSVTSKEATMKLIGKEKMGNRYKLNLEITPPKAQGKETMRIFTDTLTVKINDGDSINVSCRGFFRLK